MQDNKKSLVFFLVNLLIIAPILGENFISCAFGDTVSKVLCVISCALILIISVCKYRKSKKLVINPFLIILLIMIAQRCLITFFLAPSDLNISPTNNIITPYGLIAYGMLFYYLSLFMKDKRRLEIIFGATSIIMTAYVLLNFIFTTNFRIADIFGSFSEAFSTGYTNSRDWLFGHRNMIFIHHLIWILTSYLYCRLKSLDYTRIFMCQILFTIIVGLSSWNATMLIATVLLFLLVILRNSLFKKITPNGYLYGFLFLEIGIVFLRLQNIFSFIIVDLLNRDLSLTGRTQIWDYYINQFATGSFWNKLIGNFGITEIDFHSHNIFIGLLAFTGIIGLILYAALIFLAFKNLSKQKDKDLSRFLSITIFIFFLNGLTMELSLQPLIALYLGYQSTKISELLKEPKMESRKKKILYIINYVTNGGPTRVMENIFKELDGSKFDITLLTIIDKNDQNLIKKYRKMNINIIEFTCNKQLSDVLKKRRQIIKQIETLEPDIIHINGVVATVLCASSGISAKKVTTIHNSIFEDYRYTYGKFKGTIIALTHIIYLHGFDNVVCCSKTSYTSLKKYVRSAQYIRNGIDLYEKYPNKECQKIRRSLKIKDKDLVYIYVGVINERKRVLELIDLFNKTLQNNERLIIVGGGELLEEAKVRAKTNKIIFTGFDANPIKYMFAANIYVSNSASEGFSISIIEALGNGLLLLLSDIPSHNECFEINPKEYLGEVFNYKNFKNKKEHIAQKAVKINKKQLQDFQHKYLSASTMAKQYIDNIYN